MKSKFFTILKTVGMGLAGAATSAVVNNTGIVQQIVPPQYAPLITVGALVAAAYLKNSPRQNGGQ